MVARQKKLYTTLLTQKKSPQSFQISLNRARWFLRSWNYEWNHRLGRWIGTFCWTRNILELTVIWLNDFWGFGNLSFPQEYNKSFCKDRMLPKARVENHCNRWNTEIPINEIGKKWNQEKKILSLSSRCPPHLCSFVNGGHLIRHVNHHVRQKCDVVWHRSTIFFF